MARRNFPESAMFTGHERDRSLGCAIPAMGSPGLGLPYYLRRTSSPGEESRIESDGSDGLACDLDWRPGRLVGDSTMAQQSATAMRRSFGHFRRPRRCRPGDAAGAPDDSCSVALNSAIQNSSHGTQAFNQLLIM